MTDYYKTMMRERIQKAACIEHTCINESETNVCSLPCPAPSTREPDPVGAWGVGSCPNSQSCAIAGRADHKHLISSSFGMWGKIH
ncbi:hypothetical protein TNCV_341081 [Trichonephila clavipes]|uniref:Uncharacterized protein n=1 Tax=Trichonephila clavipes TaxID=2585209 RepID=A0A8X6VPT0_TRICX|nr:hypothetical protein TNCV_341081 [Trichonephila clavipes]